MEKAIIIQSVTDRVLQPLNAGELNKWFEDGWNFVSAAPFGIAVNSTPRTGEGSGNNGAAILVIIRKS
jgi:hypothetical protein